jgi:predicted SAM-dependent methyltransferase
MNENSPKSPLRHPPEHESGLKSVHVGCGPHNILEDWWNVDIREFKGVDVVMDVTKPWTWQNILEFVYGEHFLEHLALQDALLFLEHAFKALRPGGTIRLSTPSLEWVLVTHFDVTAENGEKVIAQTFAINRAFHGWGHKFLYSRDFLQKILKETGFLNIRFFPYGKSDIEDLNNLERHGGYSVAQGFPSVWIVEAEKGEVDNQSNEQFSNMCTEFFIKYVASGH